MTLTMREMIEKLGGNRKQIAKDNGISIQQLNNMVSRDYVMTELKDGTFTKLPSNAVIFKQINCQ